jgi:hypothetical protein
MFTTQLQRSLSNIQIVNLGVSDYSTDQELLLYQDEGRKYRPDIVVVVVAANDRTGNERTVEYVIYGKPRFVVRNGALQLINEPVAKTSWLKRAAVGLASRSFVLNELHRFLYDVEETSPALPLDKSGEHEDTVVSDLGGASHKLPQSLASWDITLRLLMELRRVTENDRAELLVVFGDGIGMPIARDMAAFLSEMHVDAILLDFYLDRNDKSLYLPDMVHWSPAGNQVVAKVVTEKLKEKLTDR